jgi:HPt (histidine-containing phosphotransfer) domain-containing protein
MIQLFLKNVPISLETIKTSIAIKDWNTVQLHAHKLRSNIDCMGIDKKYAAIAKQIEDSASKTRDLETIPGLFQKMEVTLQKACIELQQELDKK